jgi:predicted proteasome-type protease
VVEIGVGVQRVTLPAGNSDCFKKYFSFAHLWGGPNTLDDAVQLALISMDSTIRSNLTVGPPVDLLIYRRDALRPEIRLRVEEDDPYFQMIRNQWSESLRDAYRALPAPPWEDWVKASAAQAKRAG